MRFQFTMANEAGEKAHATYATMENAMKAFEKKLTKLSEEEQNACRYMVCVMPSTGRFFVAVHIISEKHGWLAGPLAHAGFYVC